jgi:hypothetical protein
VRKKDIHDPFLLEKKITTYELRKNCRKKMAQKRIQERQTITEARTSDTTLFYRIIGHQHRKLTRFIDELGLTMDSYIPREGWDPLNRFNHGGAYVKRELVSH